MTSAIEARQDHARLAPSQKLPDDLPENPRVPIVLDEISASIRSLTMLRIWYGPGERLIEPHALGLTKDHRYVLRAWQVSGASASHEPQSWKLFRLDRLARLERADRVFSGPRPGYNPDDPAMRTKMISRL